MKRGDKRLTSAHGEPLRIPVGDGAYDLARDFILGNYEMSADRSQKHINELACRIQEAIDGFDIGNGTRVKRK